MTPLMECCVMREREREEDEGREEYCGGEEGASVVNHAQSRWWALQELEEVGCGPQVEVLRPGRRHAGPQTRRLVGAQVLPSRLHTRSRAQARTTRTRTMFTRAVSRWKE